MKVEEKYKFKDLEKMSPEKVKELLDAVEKELDEMVKEEQKNIKVIEKIREQAKTQKEFLDKVVKVLIKSTTKHFTSRNDPTFTYKLFKEMYAQCGMKFTMKDAETVQVNMLELARKLYEIHERRVKEADHD